MYTKAIEEDSQDPVYYTNSKIKQYVMSLDAGAAVYIAVEEFDKSIMDCERAIELNKNYVKVCCLPEFLRLISFDCTIINEFPFRHTTAKLRL